MDDAPQGQRLSWRTRLLDRLASPALKLPSTTTAVRRLQTDVATRDGEQLKTDVFLPVAGQAKATVLIRSPYGRGFPLDVTLARPLASRGYQVVVQSVRGRSGSTGAFDPMVNEAADGLDTVAWLREQPWFTGRLAAVGGSYLGFAAWALLADAPEELEAAVLVVGPHDFADGIYGSGAFALGDFFGWSEAMTAPDDVGLVRQAREIAAARRRGTPDLTGLPLPAAGAALLEGKAPWFAAWAAHDDVDDTFWAPYRLGRALESSTVPTLLIGGWYDAFLEQTLEQHRALRDRDVPVGLTIGPWRHMDTVTKAAAEVTRETLTWLDGRFDPATGHTPAVRTFVTGADEWREDWPAPTVDVELAVAHGKLGEGDDGISTFTFDPSDPTPSVGGRLLSPMGAGVQDNRGLLKRPDVATFAGEPLTQPWEICGRPELALAISVSNPHADVFVRLCEVDPKGRASNVADGFLRLDPTVPADRVQRLSLALDPCYHRVKAGNRLVLLVAGGAHPRFARNLGTGEPAATGTAVSPQPHTVHHTGTTLRLPLAKTD
ncbi:MAG: hydrolase [Frankiales bacterium]|nr:hydrolase [Frankiales bacterium]